jgi:hypothetical protein
MYLQSEGVGGVVRGWDSCSACTMNSIKILRGGFVCVNF